MKVSIIVPVYNSERYLSDCLNSLVNQTLSEIEIIAIDDASTDHSLEILIDYAAKYPRKVKVYKNDQNKGQGASRNIGMSLASGEYIGFLDSDDYVSLTMYEDLYNAAINNGEPDVLTTRLTFVKDSSYLNKTFPKDSYQFKYNPLDNPEKVLNESPSVCNKIFLRSSMKTKFLEDCMWEDVGFTFSNLFNANSVINLNNMGYFYRKSATEGVSAKGFGLNPHLLDTFRVADQIGEETKKTGRYKELKERVKFKQITTVLQRAAEVLRWHIPDASKEKIIYNLHNLIVQKYGEWRNVDMGLLSSAVGIIELDRIKEIINKYDIVPTSPDEEVTSELNKLDGR